MIVTDIYGQTWQYLTTTKHNTVYVLRCAARHLRAFHYNDNTRPHFYQARSAWSVDLGSTRKCSAVHNFAPTVMKFCVMWEGLSPPHDTKFGNCRDEIADRRVIFIWSLIHGSGWSCLIKAEPEQRTPQNQSYRLWWVSVDQCIISHCTYIHKNAKKDIQRTPLFHDLTLNDG